MKKRAKETRIEGIGAVFVVLTGTFLALLVVLGIYNLAQGMMTESAFALVFAVLFAALLVYFIRNEKRRVKTDLPKEDEMTRRFKERAGYMAFLAMMIACLFAQLPYVFAFGLLVFLVQYFSYSKGGFGLEY